MQSDLVKVHTVVLNNYPQDDMAIARDEIFGPVMSVMKFK